MGLPGLLADVPTSRREHVFSATSLCRHSCTSDTSASASPTSSVPSPVFRILRAARDRPWSQPCPRRHAWSKPWGSRAKTKYQGGRATESEGNTAKAIVQTRYGSPDVFELREIEKPVVDDDGVLVRVRAASVNALDWHLMRGIP